MAINYGQNWVLKKKNYKNLVFNKTDSNEPK